MALDRISRHVPPQETPDGRCPTRQGLTAAVDPVVEDGPPPAPLDPVVEHGRPPPPLDPVVEHGPTPPPAFGLLVLAALVIICAGLRTVSCDRRPDLPGADAGDHRPAGGWAPATARPAATAGQHRRAAQRLRAAGGRPRLRGVVDQQADHRPCLQYSSRFTDLFNQSLDSDGPVRDRHLDPPRRAVRSFDLSSFAGVAQTALSTVTSGLSLLVLLLVHGVLPDLRRGRGSKVGSGMIRGTRPHWSADALLDFAQSVRKYWSVTTVFGLIVAAIDLIALLIIGVPMALTWGGAGLRHELHPEHRIPARSHSAGGDRFAGGRGRPGARGDHLLRRRQRGRSDPDSATLHR